MRVTCLVLVATLSASGCATRSMVAPADAYVCFQKETEGACSSNPIPTKWRGPIESALMELSAQTSVATPKMAWKVELKDARRQPTDAPWDACPSINSYESIDKQSADGKSAYIDVSGACVVYYSPVLVSQYVEEVRRLTYAVQGCNRIQQAINRQRRIFAVTDEISLPGVSAETIQTQVIRNDMTRVGGINDEMANSYQEHKTLVISGTEVIRTEMQEQYLEHEFGDKLFDALFQIKAAEESVNRQLFLLAEVSSQACPSSRVTPKVPNNAWVTKGTTVLKVGQ